MGFSFAGALYISSNIITIKNSIFMRNIAPYGGGIYLDSQLFPSLSEERNFTAISNIFYHNLAADSGGAFYINQNLLNFSITFSNCFFFKNAALLGGSYFFMNKFGGDTRVFNSTFINNLADYGGVIYTQSNSGFLFQHCSFIGNAAIKIFLKVFDISVNFGAFLIQQMTNIYIFSNITTDLLIADPIIPVFPSLDLIDLNDIPAEFENTSTYGGVFAIDLYVDPTVAKSIKNIYKRNLAFGKGGVGGVLSCNFSDEDSKFLENQSGNEGGVFDAEDQSQLLFSGSLFARNSAKNLYYVFL